MPNQDKMNAVRVAIAKDQGWEFTSVTKQEFYIENKANDWVLKRPVNHPRNSYDGEYGRIAASGMGLVFSMMDLYGAEHEHRHYYDSVSLGHMWPLYTTSLNAIQQAVLSKLQSWQIEFAKRMFDKRMSRGLIFHQLTAYDWCICYLETCGIEVK